MEFSKYLGVAEECSSSESGWTMYIVSPMHETTYHHHHHHHHGHDHDNDHVDDGIDDVDYNMCHNEDSDDSMVSDASSGPRRQVILRESSKRRSGLRHDTKHEANRDPLGKNQRHVEKKLYDRRQKAGKEHKTWLDDKARKTS